MQYNRRSAALAAERGVLERCTRRVAADGLGSGSWCHANTLLPTAAGAGLVGESISEYTGGVRAKKYGKN